MKSESFFSLLLYLHIASGTLGLVSGSIIFILKKGNQNHRNLGRLFVFGMLVSGLTALLMAVIHPNTFLFMVGVFTVYMVGSGARIIFTRSVVSRHPVDRLLQIGMGMAGLVLLYQGIMGIVGGNFFGIVFIVFASIGLTMITQDFRTAFRPNADKQAYLRKHLQRLGGGFIASSTAFLVVNIQEGPEWLASWILWLFPTALISPLIAFWSKKYKTTQTT